MWKRIVRFLVVGLAVLVTLMFGLLALFVVPSPNNQTAIEVAGVVKSISQPHPDYGDIGIVLENGNSFYINRANEVANLDWEKMLAEVQPGDKLYLTAVRPLIWRLLDRDMSMNLPVAGVRTDETVYMDTAVASTTWTSQSQYSRMAVISLLILLIFLLPDFLHLFQRRLPMASVES